MFGWEDATGYLWGLGGGAHCGAWAVYRWGLCDKVPQFTLKVAVHTIVAAVLVICFTRAAGVPPDFWWSFALFFPHGFLPLASLAISAHSYTWQNGVLSAYFGYCSLLLMWAGESTMAGVQLIVATIFVLLPMLFAAAGLLVAVQGYNQAMWRFIRSRCGWPAQS